MEKANQMRDVKITPGFIGSAHGSALIEVGRTRVICTAMIEEKVPSFLEETGKGWVTAEYSMLPGSTPNRKNRERNKTDGRSTEIQRLIGRSLRSVIDMTKLGPRSIYIDCDVIEADGGTRTASITGAFVALVYAVQKLMQEGLIRKSPIRDYVAAVSCGIVNNETVLDLCYAQDSKAQVDMNFVMTGTGEFVEIQGTGEARPFSYDEFTGLCEAAKCGIKNLIGIQKQALGTCCGLVGGR